MGVSGAIVAGNNQQFNGVIDDIRVYNRTLSGIEAQQIYFVTKPVFETPKLSPTINHAEPFHFHCVPLKV